MTTPVIYTARDRWAHEPHENFGHAVTAELAMEIAETKVLPTLSDAQREALEGWTEPDENGQRSLVIHPGSYWLEVVPVPLIGATTEWRVTGEPGKNFPDYKFVWTAEATARHAKDHAVTPEDAAHAFKDAVNARGGWPVGPHVSSRMVASGDWKQADA